MRVFYGDTYINNEELKEIGIDYPIKLEYYKMYDEVKEFKTEYQIEVIKSSYLGENVRIEKRVVGNIVKDDRVVNRILETLKQNAVTPIIAQDVIDDLLYAN